MLNPVKLMRSIFLVTSIAAAAASEARAQSPSSSWNWNLIGNIFAGVNYQNRKLADVSEVESQNWVMVTGAFDDLP
jgi:hypothetical protein